MNQLQRKRQPLEAAYIPLARRALVASILKDKARTDEIQAKREAATAMHSVHVKEFSMDVEGNRYNVKLERPWASRISVRKLYVLVQAGEVSLDDFLACITASVDAVAETLGDDVAQSLQETYQKGLDLVFSEA